MPMPATPGFVPIARRLIRRLREIDPRMLQEVTADWAKHPNHAILLKRHFMIGLCGHWSQALDLAMTTEMPKLLNLNTPKG